jgi:hypothetical protein
MSRTQFLILRAATAFVPTMSAQTSKALISGIITDGSGAAVAGAKVTITDTQRSQDFRTETNGAGVYRIIELTPGLYRFHCRGNWLPHLCA